MEWVPIDVRDQNFAGATSKKLKFYGYLAPVTPVLAWSLRSTGPPQVILILAAGKNRNSTIRKAAIFGGR